MSTEMTHGHVYTDTDGGIAVKPCTDADCPMKPCGCDSSHRCLDCATDDEVLAAIPEYPS